MARKGDEKAPPTRRSARGAARGAGTAAGGAVGGDPPAGDDGGERVGTSEPEGGGGALVPRGDDEDLRHKLDEVRFADYFAILELDPDGPLPEGAVDLAWQRLVQRFDAGRSMGRMTPEAEEALAEVRDGLADAREVLGDRLLRERYRRSIRGERGGPSPGLAPDLS